jgi:hypothetical protein
MINGKNCLDLYISIFSYSFPFYRVNTLFDVFTCLISKPPAIRNVSFPMYIDLKFLGIFSERFSSSTMGRLTNY